MDVNQDQGKTFDQCSEEEQIQILMEVASELDAPGHRIDLRKWKTLLAMEIACRFGIEWEAVHTFISYLPPDVLEGIRFTIRGPTKRKKPAKSEATSSSEGLIQGVLERYRSALLQLSPNNRTRKNLARVAGVQEFEADSFVFQNPDFAKLLVDGGEVFQGCSSRAR